jgi:hypothetical protein
VGVASRWLLAVATILITGCSDQVTEPVRIPGDPALQAHDLVHEQKQSFYCDVVTRHPKLETALRSQRRIMIFSRSEQHPLGLTQRFAYLGFADGASLDNAAICKIPATDGAVERVATQLAGGRQWQRAVFPRSSSLSGAPIALEVPEIDGVVGTACQYGGTYPYCEKQSSPPQGNTDPPPPPPGDGDDYGGSDSKSPGDGQTGLGPDDEAICVAARITLHFADSQLSAQRDKIWKEELAIANLENQIAIIEAGAAGRMQTEEEFDSIMRLRSEVAVRRHELSSSRAVYDILNAALVAAKSAVEAVCR